MKKALLVIDIQNDYFPDGLFPLWNTGMTLDASVKAIQRAQSAGIDVILVQHVVNSSSGKAPFFNKGTPGVEIHQAIRAAAPEAPVVVKENADGFYQTNLEQVLAERKIEELLICGMMTHNCVTHTAISKSAEKYKVSILSDCCATVSEMIHLIALRAVSTRVPIVTSAEAIKP